MYWDISICILNVFILYLYIYIYEYIAGSFVFVRCVVFNQGCCVFIQYNLLKG